MLLNFGPWRPDLTDLDDGCTEATNVVPALASYEPQSSLVVFSNPIESRCQGAIAVVDSAGSSYWFAGDKNHLYTINSATVSWSNVSRLTLPFVEPAGYGAGAAFGNITIVSPTGYRAPAAFGSISLGRDSVIEGFGAAAAFGNITIISPTGLSVPATFGQNPISLVPHPYATDSVDSWTFAQYGNNIYATNFADPIQVYTLASGSRFNDLGGGPPKARYLGVVKNFLVAVNTWDSTDGFVPQRVRWSGLDAPATWTVDAVTQADFQDLLGDGGSNQGIAVGLTQADAVILQERAVWRMTYQGLPSVFTFDMVEGIRGTPAPGSIIAIGGIAYYLGEDGFYAFDGAQSAPIGHGRIDQTFLADVDPAYYYRMSSVADINRKLLFWSYTSLDSLDGNPDRILVFNRVTGEWTRLEVSTEILWRTISFGYSLEDLDAFGTVDTILVSFDSRQWTGGSLQLSAFNTDHRTAHFSGAPLGATITTRELTIPDPHHLLVREAWPIIKCASATSNLRVAVGARPHANDAVSFAPSVLMNTVGYCPQRTGNHYVRLRISLSASAAWSQATGIDVQFTQIGRRA